MLPEKLYIIREILKELDMDYGMSYLTHVYSEMLRQTTRDLYQRGEVEAYKRAVRFEIENNFSTINMSHEMTKQLAEKVRMHMHVSNRNISYIESQTGLSTEVITALLKGHGSIENFLTVMMTLGLTLQMKDINTFYIDYVKEEEKDSIAVISPITYEDYEIAQRAIGENIRQFREIGGNINFNMTSIGNDVIVGGTIDYDMRQADLESSEFKVESKEFFVTVMIYPELRSKLIADYLKKPNAIAMSLGGKYIITVEHLLNALYQIEGDDAYYMLIPIPYRLRDEEELLIANCIYEITMNVNGTTTTSKLHIDNENIIFKGTIIDAENEENVEEDTVGGESTEDDTTGEFPGDIGGEPEVDTDEGTDIEQPDAPPGNEDTGDTAGPESDSSGDVESDRNLGGTIDEDEGKETTTPSIPEGTETDKAGTDGDVSGEENDDTILDTDDSDQDGNGNPDDGSIDGGNDAPNTDASAGTGGDRNENQPTESKEKTEVGNDHGASDEITPDDAGH